MNARAKTTISTNVLYAGCCSPAAMKMEGTRDELISFSNPRSITLKKMKPIVAIYLCKDVVIPTPGITRSNPG